MDGSGQRWDVKQFPSNDKYPDLVNRDRVAAGKLPQTFPPGKKWKGSFNLTDDMKKIRDSLRDGERVVIDTTFMNPDDISTLERAVTAADLESIQE